MNHKDTLRQFYATLTDALQGGAADLGAFFTDDIRWHLPQSAAQAGKALYEGKAEVMQLFGGGVAQFYEPASMRFTYHSIIADGDHAHCHFSLEAVTAGGKPYLNHYQSLFRMRDGRIAEVWEYFDTAYLFSVFAD
jgi:ketosteroid isomerase-like protein